MLRLFAWVRVVSATGKSRRRRVGVRKAKTLDELVLRFTSNVKRFVTDPTIKAIVVDVRIPPSREDFEPGDLEDLVEAGEDDFAWRHEPEITARVADGVQAALGVPVTVGVVAS